MYIDDINFEVFQLSFFRAREKIRISIDGYRHSVLVFNMQNDSQSIYRIKTEMNHDVDI